MENTFCREIEVLSLDERVIIRLYENEGDETHKATIGLDIDDAKELCKLLVKEIARAEENNKG